MAAAREMVTPAAPLVWTRNGDTSVQMVVRRDEPATVSTAEPAAQPRTIVTTGQWEAGRRMGAVTVSTANAAQPKIDLNRLTDDVYRMLERRLITERERRGR